MSETMIGAAPPFTRQITVQVNGEDRQADVEPRLLLAHFLRQTLGLTGTHIGCDTTSCGACTVLLDGMPVKSCTVLAVQADGRNVQTVEGLMSDGTLHPIQQAFHEEHGLQCGYCTPGMMLTSVALLAENPDPSEEEIRWAISGHICRCTGYQKIVNAVKSTRRDDAGRELTMASPKFAGSATPSSARRMPASSAARATTSTTSCCRACCTWRSCAARTRTRVSRRSTRRGCGAAGRGRRRHRRADGRAQPAWMPTLSGDTQAVLATDKVRFQGQEVAAVIAEDPYVAKDALELIEVDYEPLPAVTTPHQALAEGAALIRDEKEGQTDNHVYHWEAGDQGATEKAFAEADKIVSLDTFYPRCHPSPLECCGCVADVNPATGQATIYMTSQAPHAHRTLFAIVAGLPEEKIRIISPDIGGGFGNKVPIYPGYVVATAASLLIGRPVKWIEDRTGNLISTGFARDYHMHGELAIKDGKFSGAAREDALRPGSVLRRRAADEVPRRRCSTSSPARTTSPRRGSRRTARTRTRRREASRTAARSASPRRRT